MRSTAELPVYVFSDFRLDPTRRVLMRGDEPVPLHPKAFELLTLLVENSDRILTKNELLNTIWESQFVEENNLAVQIAALRKMFGEKSGENRYIVTVPGRGYQFVAKVSTSNGFATWQEYNGRLKPSQPSTSAPSVASPTDALPRSSVKAAIPYLLGVAFASAIALAFVFWPGISAPESRQWKLTKQTATGNVRNATISRDGKFIVFSQTESDGESLWLRQIDTGSQTRIIAPDELEYVGLTISPDNNFVYFSTFGSNQAPTPLQRVPLLGGAPQLVGNIDCGVAVSFSPDGKRFTYTTGTSSLRESYLNVADADGSNTKVLVRAEGATRTIQYHKVRPAAWSPDGSVIALAFGNRPADGMKKGIVLVDVNEGVERMMLQPRFASIHSLVWLDKEKLAFVASEFNEPASQIWTVSTKGDDANRITNDLQDYSWISASLGGELLTVQKNAISSLNVIPFDENNKAPNPLEVVHEVELDTVTFGPDDAVLYTSRATGSREIWKVPVNGGDPKQMTVDARVRKGFSISPTDRSLVFGSDRLGTPGLWLADRSGNILRRLTEAEDVYPQFFPDGRSLVFQRGSANFPTLWRIETDGGTQPVQLVNYHSAVPTLSPDGSLLAFYFMDFKVDGAWRIGIVSAKSGAFVKKLSFPAPVSERRMKWHPSGAFIGQVLNGGDGASLLLLPVDGGTGRTISGLGKGRVGTFAWSSDGKTLVYALTVETQDAVSMAAVSGGGN